MPLYRKKFKSYGMMKPWRRTNGRMRRVPHAVRIAAARKYLSFLLSRKVAIRKNSNYKRLHRYAAGAA